MMNEEAVRYQRKGCFDDLEADTETMQIIMEGRPQLGAIQPLLFVMLTNDLKLVRGMVDIQIRLLMVDMKGFKHFQVIPGKFLAYNTEF